MLLRRFRLARADADNHRIARGRRHRRLAGDADRDRRSRGFHYCNPETCIARLWRLHLINYPERVVEAILKGDTVSRSQHGTGKGWDGCNIINIYCHPTPLHRVVSVSREDEGMHPWSSITARRSHMNCIDIPVKPVRCALRRRSGNVS